ncbi:MAG: hypothetical protein WC441_04760 [Patescibacteria group bacterium]
MDTVIYRALTKDLGRECFGYYGKIEGKHCIILDDAEIKPIDPDRGLCDGIYGFVEVQPHTVAQYTGRLDKNKKPIFGSIEIDGVRNKGGDRLRYNYHIDYPDCDFFGDVVWDIRVLEPNDEEAMHVGFVLYAEEKNGEVWYSCIPDLKDVEVIGRQYD